MNKKNKTGVVIDLYKIDAKEFYVSDDATRLIQYRKYKLWFLYECMYWYAIEVNGEYYAFDIRKITSLIGFEDSDQKDKTDWLLKFVECLESSEFYIDFENSIRQYLKPVSRTPMTNKYRFVDLYLSIVKWIKRFHLNFDNSLF